MSSPFVFPSSVPLAQKPTPLMPLSRLSRELGRRIWIKRDDLTGSLLSGNKVRKLEFVIAEALTRGADTLVTCGGLQSNHCRATAFVAASVGLDCELVLRGEPEGHLDGNLLLSALAGARVHTHKPVEYYQHLPELLAERMDTVTRAGREPYLITTGASDGVGIWGYIKAAEELAEDCRRLAISAPEVICATGSGGTLAGLATGLWRYLPDARVVGVAVCDSAAYFRQRVAEDVSAAMLAYPHAGLQEPDNFTITDHYIGPGYARADAEIYQLIAQLARTEGVLLDQVYTAKAFYGMLAELKLGHLTAEDIIFVHTGGVFGLFPERQALMAALTEAAPGSIN